MRTGTPSARPFFKVSRDQNRRPSIANCKELHQAVNCKKSEENKKAKALWSLKGANNKGIDVYDLGSVPKIQTRSQVRLDLGNPPEECDDWSGKRTETHRAKMLASDQQRAMCRVTSECFFELARRWLYKSSDRILCCQSWENVETPFFFFVFFFSIPSPRGEAKSILMPRVYVASKSYKN